MNEPEPESDLEQVETADTALAEARPAASSAETVVPAEVPDAEPTTPEAEPAAAEDARPAVATRSSTGMWAVQLGSFSNQANAERLAADLRQQGFAAFLSDVSTTNGVLHRVRIGPQKDRESAEVMAERLARAGHTGQVVPHP